MIIRSVQLRNFRVHREREIQFSPVTCIVGPNGSGKSSLIDAIYFALTGDLLEPHKLSVTSGQQTGSVSVMLTDGSRHLIVNRSFGDRSQATLMDNTSKLAENALKVNMELWVKLQVVDKRAFSCQIAKQGELDEFITSRASERAAFFMRLIPNIDALENVWHAIGIHMASIRVDPAADEDPEKLRQRICSLDGSIADLEKQLQHWEEIGRKRSLLVQKGAILTAIEVIRSRIPDVKAYKTRLQQIKAEKAQLLQEEEKLEPAAAKAKSLLQQKQRFEKEVQDVIQRFRNRPRLPDRRKRDNILYRLGYVTGVSDTVGTLLGAADTGRCPVCETPLQPTKMREIIEHKSRAQLELYKQRQDLGRQLSDRDPAELEQEIAAIRYRRRLRDDARRLRELRKQFQSIDVGVIQRYEQVQKRLVELERELAGMAQAIKESTNPTKQLERLDAELKELDAELEKLSHVLLTESGSCQCRECVLHWRKAERPTIKDLQTNLQLAIRERDDLRYRLHRYEQAVKRKQLYEYLLSLRQIFHWDNLSQRLCREILILLLPEVNEILSGLGAEFEVVLDETQLGLKAIFSDGREVPDFIMSGGERICLALAVRLALARHYNRSFPVLIIDEPTVYLDAVRRQHLCSLFQRMAQYIHRLGAQLIVVTHDTVLSEALSGFSFSSLVSL